MLEAMLEFHLLSHLDPKDVRLQGWFPLIAAVRMGNLEWVELLCRHKIRGAHSKFPPIFCMLKWAKLLRNLQNDVVILETLIEHGEDVDEFYDGETPVFYAAKEQLWHCVEVLMKHGAKIDTFCGTRTARRIIQELKSDLLVNIPEPDIRFQLLEALKLGEEANFISLLDPHPEMCNEVNDQGTTLLLLAVQQKMAKAVEKLLHFGANPNIDKRTRPIPPIILSIISGSRDIFTTLLYHKDLKPQTTYRGQNTIYHLLAREWRLVDEKLKLVALESVEDLFKASFSCGVDILAKNTKGYAAVNLACKSRDMKLIKSFFRYGAMPSLNRYGLKQIPPPVLNEWLDECASPHLHQDYNADYIDINFSFIDAAAVCKVKKKQKVAAVPNDSDSDSSDISDRSSSIYLKMDFENIGFDDLSKNDNLLWEMNLLYMLTKSKEHVHLLKHPVIRVFLYMKWKKISRYYILNFIFYLIFTIILSVFVMNITNTFSSNDDNTDLGDMKTVSWILTLIFWTFIVLREVMQLMFSIRNYFTDLENCLEITLLSLVGFLLFGGPQREVASVSVILAYIELTLLIGRYPFVSTYVTIFIQVAKKSIGLILIFSPVIFAFAFGFHIIFLNSSILSGPFSNLGLSLFQSIIMMSGELETSGIDFNISFILSRLIFLLFIIFIVIVFSNVLNALAISDTQLIVDEAELLSCIQEVILYMKFEKLWIRYLFLFNDDSTRVSKILIRRLFQCKFFTTRKTWFSINVFPLHFCYDTGSHYKLFTQRKYMLHSILVHRYLFGFDHLRISKMLVEITQANSKESDSTEDPSMTLQSFADEISGKVDLLKSEDREISSALGNKLEETIAELETKVDKMTNDIQEIRSILIAMQQKVN